MTKMVKGTLIVLAMLGALAADASAVERTAGDRWEQSLLQKKRAGTLPGPRPGQKCLWSKALNECLWYSPSTLSWDSVRGRSLPRPRVQPRNWTTMQAGWGMYGNGYLGLPF